LKLITCFRGGKITLLAGRVFDGQTLLGEQHIEIIISGGTIISVHPPAGESPTPQIQADEILDLREYTVLPGLVDCHVHLALDGRDFSRSLEMWRHKEQLQERIEADLARTMGAGVAAVRDGGDREAVGMMARELAARGVAPGPLVRVAGPALRKKGGYGSFLGPGLKGESPGKAVEDLARLGVDQIKVLVSGVVSFKTYGLVGDLQFSQGELAEIVSAAKAVGLRVMAHASSDQAVRLALRAGVDSLEHGYFVSQESLEELARAGIPWVPTLAPVACQVQGALIDRYSPEKREVINKTLFRQQEMVKRAADLGVRIGVGSDAGAVGVPHGLGLLAEMLCLEEAGLTRTEILRAATAGGAAILGLDREIGSVRPGRRACLIAVRGNPLEDLRLLGDPGYMILPPAGQANPGRV